MVVAEPVKVHADDGESLLQCGQPLLPAALAIDDTEEEELASATAAIAIDDGGKAGGAAEKVEREAGGENGARVRSKKKPYRLPYRNDLFTVKLLLVGDFGVGKSCLLRRYCPFMPGLTTTTGELDWRYPCCLAVAFVVLSSLVVCVWFHFRTSCFSSRDTLIYVP